MLRPSRSLPPVLILALLVPLAACTAPGRRASAPAQPVLESSEMGSMHNVSVSGDIWMGSCPDADDLDLAARRGIARVIDLRSTAERRVSGEDGRELAPACAELDLELVEADVPEDLARVSDAAVDQVLELLGRGDAKTLLLCRDGRRSALFFAIHRVVHEGVALEEALLEARRCGVPPGPDEDFVRAQVRRLVGA